MEKKGMQTERGDINREIKELNTPTELMNTHIMLTTREIGTGGFSNKN
jgi:hypothetical protein